MERRALDYAVPHAARRGVVQSGLFAHVLASYAVSLALAALLTADGAPFAPALVAFSAAAPLWMPAALLFAAAFMDALVLGFSLSAAYVAILVLTYRYLRRPQHV